MERQGEKYECKSKPFSGFGKLGIPGLRLSLGKESIGSAGDGTGKSGAFAALHKNYSRYSQT